MNHVQEHCETHTMGRVDQFFQVLWRAKSTASRKEAIDLITKTCVVCMFHNCHQLYDIVAKTLDSGKNVRGKFLICRDS